MASAITLSDLADSLFPTPKEFVSVKELAEQTSVSERTIRHRVASGELEFCKLGSRRLVRRDSFNEPFERLNFLLSYTVRRAGG